MWDRQAWHMYAREEHALTLPTPTRNQGQGSRTRMISGGREEGGRDTCMHLAFGILPCPSLGWKQALLPPSLLPSHLTHCGASAFSKGRGEGMGRQHAFHACCSNMPVTKRSGWGPPQTWRALRHFHSLAGPSLVMYSKLSHPCMEELASPVRHALNTALPRKERRREGREGRKFYL